MKWNEACDNRQMGWWRSWRWRLRLAQGKRVRQPGLKKRQTDGWAASAFSRQRSWKLESVGYVKGWMRKGREEEACGKSWGALPWLESAGLKGSFRGRSGISREEEEEEEGSGDFKPSINFSTRQRGEDRKSYKGKEKGKWDKQQKWRGIRRRERKGQKMWERWKKGKNRKVVRW